jgi:integrase
MHACEGITVTAANGVSPAATQPFTLTVDQAPAFTGKPRRIHGRHPPPLHGADQRLPGGEDNRAGPAAARGPARLIFTNARGTAVKSNVFDSGHWHPALKAAGMAKSRENGFHALRHRFASVLLHDGVDIKALSEYLGHHDPGFTLTIYVHLMPDAADRMRSVIDKALSPEAEGPSTAQEATE